MWLCKQLPCGDISWYWKNINIVLLISATSSGPVSLSYHFWRVQREICTELMLHFKVVIPRSKPCLQQTVVDRDIVDTDRGRQLLLLFCWHAAFAGWCRQGVRRRGGKGFSFPFPPCVCSTNHCVCSHGTVGCTAVIKTQSTSYKYTS